MTTLSPITKSTVLLMKEYPSQTLQVRHGMIWFGNLKNENHSDRKAYYVAFLRLLRYNIMDCQQGGKAFD